MTGQWNRTPEGVYEVVLQGSWEGTDAVELKRILDEIPRDQDRVILGCGGLDGFPAALVQVALAYVRYCRSIPRPVTIRVGPGQTRLLASWGLDRSGWEGFFRVG